MFFFFFIYLTFSSAFSSFSYSAFRLLFVTAPSFFGCLFRDTLLGSREKNSCKKPRTNEKKKNLRGAKKRSDEKGKKCFVLR
jgi:hypothetical protein